MCETVVCLSTKTSRSVLFEFPVVKINSKQLQCQNMQGTTTSFKLPIIRNNKCFIGMESLEEKGEKVYRLAKDILNTVCLIEKTKSDLPISGDLAFLILIASLFVDYRTDCFDFHT